MGDVFHSFPALSDALQNRPGLVVDWVVEKSFSEIPKWHPAVDKVYAIELRKWRKTPFAKQTRQEIKEFFERVNQTQYDLILDAQGLYKSLWVARRVKAPVVGFDFRSARESLVSLFYSQKYRVAKDQHAILRLRQLFAQVLDYPFSDSAAIVYGLNTQAWSKPEAVIERFANAPYWVFLHGTTWETKYWPESYWTELLQTARAQGVKVILPWGNQEEHERALRIAASVESPVDAPVKNIIAKQSVILSPNSTNLTAWVPEAMLNLNEMAKILKHAHAVVSVDTGLSHVAAALEVPMVVLYRVTDPKLVGAAGAKVTRLESPCAPDYLKVFKNSEQSKRSLQGLSVKDVENVLIAFEDTPW